MYIIQNLVQEDQQVVERVQRGLASGLVDQGRLLPRTEHLIGWFQRLVCRGLADPGGSN